MTITQNLSINLAEHTYFPVVHAVKGDTGRMLAITIQDYSIPSGSVVKLYYTAPMSNTSYIIGSASGNVATVNLADALTIAGEVSCNLAIESSDQSEILSSYRFMLYVETNNSDGEIQ